MPYVEQNDLAVVEHKECNATKISTNVHFVKHVFFFKGHVSYHMHEDQKSVASVTQRECCQAVGRSPGHRGSSQCWSYEYGCQQFHMVRYEFGTDEIIHTPDSQCHC